MIHHWEYDPVMRQHVCTKPPPTAWQKIDCCGCGVVVTDEQLSQYGDFPGYMVGALADEVIRNIPVL